MTSDELYRVSHKEWDKYIMDFGADSCKRDAPIYGCMPRKSPRSSLYIDSMYHQIDMWIYICTVYQLVISDSTYICIGIVYYID